MKTQQSLRAAQRTMRRRQNCRRPPGRPALNINVDVVIDLLLRGYSRRGIAIHLGCDERTLERRFADLFCAPFDLTKLSRQFLFRIAVKDKNPKALMYCAKKFGACRPDEDDYALRPGSTSANDGNN